jgi:hypothetical protein
MISRIWTAVFTPKYPKGYTGRHRAGTRFTFGAGPAGSTAGEATT